jgi:hypothetical protein
VAVQSAAKRFRRGFIPRQLNLPALAGKSLSHGYLGIDNDTLWSIIQTDIPSLLPQLRQLRDTTQ